jgi:hypothetical protein
MIERIEGLVSLVAALTRAGITGLRANLPLTARMLVVAAVGGVAVHQLNLSDPVFVIASTGDATTLVAQLIRAQAQVSLDLMTLGRDIFAFVWF